MSCKTIVLRYSYSAFVPYQQHSNYLAFESEVLPYLFNNTPRGSRRASRDEQDVDLALAEILLRTVQAQAQLTLRGQ